VQIIDAPIAEVAAWEMAKKSRDNMKEHAAFGGLDKDLKKINNHKNIYHVVFDVSIPRFVPRQWVQAVVWMWSEDKQELTVVYDDTKHDTFPELKEYLRASSTTMYKYKQEAGVGEIPQTKVTYTQQVDLGGSIPKWVQNGLGVRTLMYVAMQASNSTLRQRPPLTRRSLQVFEHHAQALRQELGDRRGEQPAPGDHDSEPRRAVY
jgi:hypothetical protein